jgi:hypothetical protein
MADQGIKKVIVPQSGVGSLGPLNTHTLRYRIVSEDKNRFSAWSAIYNVIGSAVDLVSGDVNLIGNTVIVSWGDEVLRPGYDIFVGWNNQAPTYHGTTPIHTYSFLKTGTLPLRVIVQVQGINKELDEAIEIYDSEELTEGDIG